MASLESAQLRQALAKGVVRQVTNDANIAIRLRYVGSGTVTSVVVTSATDVVLTTSDGGTDTYTFAAYTTIGALADAINKDGIFEAKVLDCLRSEGSDDYFLSATVTAGADEDGEVIWDLVGDTSGAATIAVCLTPTGPEFSKPAGHRVHLQELSYYSDHTAAVNTVQVWKRKGTVETQLLGLTGVDTTLTTVNWASGEGKISGGPDEELIVLCTGTVINSASNLVRAVGIYE